MGSGWTSGWRCTSFSKQLAELSWQSALQITLYTVHSFFAQLNKEMRRAVEARKKRGARSSRHGASMCDAC